QVGDGRAGRLLLLLLVLRRQWRGQKKPEHQSAQPHATEATHVPPPSAVKPNFLGIATEAMPFVKQNRRLRERENLGDLKGQLWTIKEQSVQVDDIAAQKHPLFLCVGGYLERLSGQI